MLLDYLDGVHPRDGLNGRKEPQNAQEEEISFLRLLRLLAAILFSPQTTLIVADQFQGRDALNAKAGDHWHVVSIGVLSLRGGVPGCDRQLFWPYRAQLFLGLYPGWRPRSRPYPALISVGPSADKICVNS